ncbi:MAG: hypothetical protein NC412_05900 [Roseburia sp.]|nr:hypothetical protein [Roseburia sp.]
MAVGQITWEQFITSNNDARGVRYKFEDLSRQLFTYEFLSRNNVCKFVHSNPNNPGIESEPILDEVNNRYIGYQAKFFDNGVDYSQIKDSAQKAVKHYKGKLDLIYLFCNKAITTTCDSYKSIEKMLNDAGIALQPITDTTILDLVRKYPLLGKYYFDDHGISHEWFVNKASITVNILGERFNADFNVDTEASRNLSVFLQNQSALDYYNDRKRSLVEEIASLRWELNDLYKYARKLSEFIVTIPDVKFDSIHDVENWQDIISTAFEHDIAEIENQIANAQTDYEEIKESDQDKATQISSYLRKLNKLKNLFRRLELSEIDRSLLNNKILIVEGKAGIGKTQLFANEVISLLNANENALLIIGSDCLSDINIFEQLRNNLRLDFDFENLIDILEIIGETNGKIVPILIDALNESWKPQLWKSVLPILYKKVSDKKHVRLAVSFRSEYQNSILPDRFIELDNVVQIEHKGFRNNPLEAAKKFLSHYGIPFTPLQMFTTNIDNPLFLTLYCKTYQGDEVELPVLYERLLEKANDKLYIKLAKTIEMAGYDQSDNIVLPIVEAISKQTLLTGKRHFEKSEIESLTIWNSLGLVARPVITQLIHENILHDYESDGKNYVYFSFDQMNDYFSAKAILSMFQTEEEIRKYVSENVLGIVDGEFNNWASRDLFAHVCALYAEKFGKECIYIIQSINDRLDKEDLFRAYIESFEWRSKIYLSISELLELCNEYSIEPSILWDVFINNSVKLGHLMNADALHDVLKRYPLAKRDYFWTTFINGRSSDDARIVQLVEIYNKGETLEVSDKEQIRLLLILFSWVLTSSNRWLRDTTSKAMVEILKDHFEYSEYLLKIFSDVNDPYVIQRLYGIVFGACVKRNCENKEKFKSLVCFVFEDIFSKDTIYPDILLRDYARLIIERYLMEYPGELQGYDFGKIEPPYKSIPIPDIDDQKYSDKDFENGMFYIQHSMRFEGMGMYGDFGRYVFQSALRNFEVDDYKIFNYAMYYIINELGYRGDLFDDYDRFVTRFGYDRHRVLKTERIGKKYQWIAMYNILARISDYYPMKNRFSMEEEIVSYDGPWEPYVKDFDPTLNAHNLLCDDAPYFLQVNEHIRESIQENNCAKNDHAFDEDKWTNANSIFFEYQKEDLLLTDDEGIQWVVLSKYADTGRDNLAYDKLMVWNWLYGYFVTDEQLSILKEYAGKKVNLLNSDITRIPETYTIYNREYPWSSGSKSVLDWQWENIELRTDEIKLVTSTVEEPQFSCIEALLKKYSGIECNEDVDSESEIDLDGGNIPIVAKTYTKEETVTIDLGKVLNATQILLWEEEFDASKEEALSSSHPCAEIINVLGLRQKKYDGYYYNETGELIAFDTDLTKQKAGLIIKRDALDKFLKFKNLHLVWFVNASKEIHGKALMITKFTDWTGLLEYTSNSVQGEYYIIES